MGEIPTEHLSPQYIAVYTECTGLVRIPNLYVHYPITQVMTLASYMSCSPLTAAQPTECEAVYHPMQGCIFVTVSGGYKWIATNVNTSIWIVMDTSSTEVASEMLWCIIYATLHYIFFPDNVIYSD